MPDYLIYSSEELKEELEGLRLEKRKLTKQIDTLDTSIIEIKLMLEKNASNRKTRD